MIRLLRLLKRLKQGSSKATAGPGEIFLWDFSVEKIFEFSLLKRRILVVYFIFLSDGEAPQTSRGRGNLPISLPRRARQWISEKSRCGAKRQKAERVHDCGGYTDLVHANF